MQVLTDLRKKLRNHIGQHETTAFLGMFVLVSQLTYLRSNILKFGRLDDFTGLFNSYSDTIIDGVFHSWFQAGRIIPATFGSLLFNFTDSVGDLVYLRLISTGILGLAGGVIALFTWRLFRDKNYTSFVGAVLVGIVAITTTSAPSAATWATFAAQMPTLPLAFVSGIICTTTRKYFGLPWWCAALALLVASAFCYQQFVPLAVLPVCMWAAIEYVSFQRIHLKRIFATTSLVVVALALNAVFVFLFGDGAQDRVLGEPISERIRWFIGTYTPRTIDLFIPNTQTSGLLSLLVLGILIISPVLINWRNIAFLFATVAAWAACAAVVFPTQLWASYRLIHPAQIALWSCAAFSAIYVFTRARRKSVSIAAVVIGIFLLINADNRALNYIAKPNHYDWQTTVCEIRRNPEVNVFVVSEWDMSRSPVYSYDEYGTIASNFDWVFIGSIRMARLEISESMNTQKQLIDPKLISKSDSVALPDGTFLVIDQKMCE
jgi:hypothetical protein